MPDLFVLSMLDGAVTVAGHAYWVTWNCEKQVAEVERDGAVIASFPYELRAWQHVMEIQSELEPTRDTTSWKNID